MNTSRYWKRFFIFTVAFILSIRQSFAFLPDGVNRVIESLFIGIDRVYQIRFLLWLLLFALFYYLLENYVFDDSGGSFGSGSKNLKGAKITMALALAALCALLPPAAFIRDIWGLYANLFWLSLMLGTLIALFYALGKAENEDELPPSKILGRGFLLLVFSFLLMSDIVRVLIENAQSLGINDLADWFNLAGIAFLLLAIWLIGTAFVRMAGRSVRGASKDIPSGGSGGSGGLSKSDADLLLKEQEKELQDDFQDQLDEIKKENQENIDALEDEKQEVERQRILDNLTQDALNQLDKLILSFRKLLDNARNNNLSMVKDDVEDEVLKPMSDSLEGLEKSMKDINDELKNQKSLLENVESDLKELNKSTKQRINKIQNMIQGLEKEKNNVTSKQMKKEIASLQENLKDELNTIKQSQNNLSDGLDVVRQELQDIDDLQKIDEKIDNVIQAWNKRLSQMVKHTQSDIDDYDERMKNELLEIQSKGLVDSIQNLFEMLENQEEELKTKQGNLQMITESYQDHINAQLQDWENLARKYNAVRQKAAETRRQKSKKTKKSNNKGKSSSSGNGSDILGGLKAQKQRLDNLEANIDVLKNMVKDLDKAANSDEGNVKDVAESYKEEIKNKLESLRKELNEEINAVEDEMKECQNLIESAQGALGPLQKKRNNTENDDVIQEIAKIRVNIKSHLNAYNKWKKTYESLKQEFKNRESALKELLTHLDQDNVGRFIQVLREDIADMKELKQNISSEIQHAERMYSEKKTLEDLIDQVSEV